MVVAVWFQRGIDFVIRRRNRVTPRTEDMTSNAAVRTPRMHWRAVAGLAAAAALISACSSDSGGLGVASLGSSASPTGSAANKPHASALAYSRCMRAHGVPAFPDPGANGELQLRAGPGTGIDPNSPTFKAAQQTCKSLLPTPPPEQQRQNYEALLKFAKCMRSHGITDFPDPQSNGGLRIAARAGSDLDPNSSLFKDAQQACQKYMPGGGKLRGGTNTGNG